MNLDFLSRGRRFWTLESPEKMEPHGVQGPPEFTETDVHTKPVTEDVLSMSWDWSDLLEFTTDDHLDLPLDSDQIQLTDISLPEPQPEPPVPNLDRIRKRDPRLTCSNFLAGRIPCACPELDEMLAEEEEAGLPGKKRVRTVRAGPGQAWCQVPDCEVDISELKGYHKRHRVCLRCANASAVSLDGESKRYCQQCGKFHILSDFDEGKRSCRRKLEWHNNRRRRKSGGSKGALDKEPPGSSRRKDLVCDGDAGKDSLCVSSQLGDQEALFESEDGHVSTLNSAPNSQNVNSDSGVSFAASGETQMDGGKDDSKVLLSPSYYDNKSAYSSMCPTGRISFKLYDWNPAEFPRGLRHQIFQWLSSMPVELEGYIRPGCTIFTVFIAMPKIMWVQLYEDPITYVHNFVVAPGRMISGRGFVIVNLNNMIFHVKDGTSVMKVNAKVQAPKLHYVHPTCFEAGKPMEFVACGSNLLQSKFRFLISFAGKYLPNDFCIASPHSQSKGVPLTFDHQLYKIHVPQTEQNLFGPAFIEVENESGLSNFIPVLIGDKETCHEMNLIQHRIEASLFPERSQFVAGGSICNSCRVSALRQTTLSEFLLDIAWLLKVPASESFQQIMSASQIQRFNLLLSFLIHNESTSILEKMLQHLKILIDKMGLNNAVIVSKDTEIELLLKYMNYARENLHPKLQTDGGLMQQHSGNIVPKLCSDSQSCFRSDLLVSIMNQDCETRPKDKSGETVDSTAVDRSSEIDLLLSREIVMNLSLNKEWPRKSCGQIFSGTVLISRPAIFVATVVTVCFGVCVVLFHPHQVGELAVSIRRSLLSRF